MTAPLRQNPCRSLCAWGPTDAVRDDDRLFACAGCGSQWVRSQPWTPCDRDGAVPDPVVQERQR